MVRTHVQPRQRSLSLGCLPSIVLHAAHHHGSKHGRRRGCTCTKTSTRRTHAQEAGAVDAARPLRVRVQAICRWDSRRQQRVGQLPRRLSHRRTGRRHLGNFVFLQFPGHVRGKGGRVCVSRLLVRPCPCPGCAGACAMRGGDVRLTWLPHTRQWRHSHANSCGVPGLHVPLLAPPCRPRPGR